MQGLAMEAVLQEQLTRVAVAEQVKALELVVMAVQVL
jgi:hypothetical protein